MMNKHYFFLGYKYISLKIIFFDKNKKDIRLNVMQLMNLNHLFVKKYILKHLNF